MCCLLVKAEIKILTLDECVGEASVDPEVSVHCQIPTDKKTIGHLHLTIAKKEG